MCDSVCVCVCMCVCVTVCACVCLLKSALYCLSLCVTACHQDARRREERAALLEQHRAPLRDAGWCERLSKAFEDFDAASHKVSLMNSARRFHYSHAFSQAASCSILQGFKSGVMPQLVMCGSTRCFLACFEVVLSGCFFVNTKIVARMLMFRSLSSRDNSEAHPLKPILYFAFLKDIAGDVEGALHMYTAGVEAALIFVQECGRSIDKDLVAQVNRAVVGGAGVFLHTQNTKHKITHEHQKVPCNALLFLPNTAQQKVPCNAL